MDIIHSGVGNLGADPETKTVTIGGEERKIVEMRVYFDRRRKTEDGFVDDGGFWHDVSVWHEGLGERAMKLLKKGSRIYVHGSVKASQYTDSHDQDRIGYTVYADYIALDTLGIESVVRKAAKRTEKTAA